MQSRTKTIGIIVSILAVTLLGLVTVSSKITDMRSTKNSRNDTPATTLRDQDIQELKGFVLEAAPGKQVKDGGTTGPFPCTNAKTGQEFYTVNVIIDPGSSQQNILEQFESLMIAKDYKADKTASSGARSTVTYSDKRKEISVATYQETGLIQFSVNTECGNPESS